MSEAPTAHEPLTTGDPPASAPARVSTARLALVTGVAAAAALLFVIPYRIAQGGYPPDVSGAWAVLADDVAHGILYRPLVSELGYGGTRYFPLQPVVHGLLVALGLPLRPAGHLISLLAGAALVVFGAKGLEKYGADPKLAWATGALTLISRTAFLAVAGIRGDIFPVALGVIGLALTPKEERARIWPAALFLGLAVLAKPTLVWAPGGALLALLCAGRLKRAIELGAAVGALVAFGLLGAQVASHGEMLRSFRACASGGGFSLGYFFDVLRLVRPGEWAWILGGLALSAWRGRRALTHPFCAAGVVCLPVAILLHTSRGIHVNHLIDLTVLGALAIGAAVADADARRLPKVVLAVATVLGLGEAVLLDGMVLRRGELDEAAAALPAGKGPVLAEQPWIPLLAGERAVLLDAYALVQTRRTNPQVERDLFARIERCDFRAVVLIGRAEGNDEWYQSVRFGTGFAPRLLANYSFSRVAGAHALYLPHCGAPAGAPVRVEGPPADTVLTRGGAPSKLRALLKSLLQ